jgi:hypothetical protein
MPVWAAWLSTVTTTGEQFGLLSVLVRSKTLARILFNLRVASFLLVAVTLLFAFGANSAAAAQDLPGGSAGPANSDAALMVDSTDSLLVGEPGGSPDQKAGTPATPDPDKLKVVIYPIMAWAPILGANVRIPNTPSTPGGGSGSTGVSLNGAALFGFTIQQGKWYGDANAMWAGMSTSRTSPHLNIDINGIFAGGQIGYKVYRDFYFTGGFRRLAFKYDVTLGTFPQFERKPGVWDPLVGVLWNRRLARKWTAKINVQGGGFGVGADVDFSAVGTATGSSPSTSDSRSVTVCSTSA